MRNKKPVFKRQITFYVTEEMYDYLGRLQNTSAYIRQAIEEKQAREYVVVSGNATNQIYPVVEVTK